MQKSISTYIYFQFITNFDFGYEFLMKLTFCQVVMNFIEADKVTMWNQLCYHTNIQIFLT